MFRKREKKVYPPGTFIPTPARVMAIIQLCMAFSLFLWILSQPFMGDLFTIKSQLLIYETVLGKKDLPSPGQMERNAERFSALPVEEQNQIENGDKALKAEMQSSILQKLQRSFELLFVKAPPMELVWIIFSIAIPLCLLMRIEGSVQAVWLLVLITMVYAADNRLNAVPQANQESHLFPSEEYLLQHYLKEDLKPSLLEQEQQLIKGWKLYLVDHWAKEKPSDNRELFDQQVEKGEFAFNVARIKDLTPIKKVLSVNAPTQKLTLFNLAIYLFWNTLLAIVVTMSCRKRKLQV